MDCSVDLRRLNWTGPLARDYCYSFDRLEPFYAGAPTSASAWRKVIAAQQVEQSDRIRLADLVTAQLNARAAPPEAIASAKQLARPDTIAVVTGQQASLFGGPLFTLLKAVTTIKLARQVAADHKTRVVPVFWVDAEDHDLDEIRTCSVLDDDLELHRVSLMIENDAYQPASTVELHRSITDTVEELRGVLPETEYSTELLKKLATTYASGTRLVDAFAQWLDWWLGRHGLVVFDASDAAAKPLVKPIFERELQTRGETAKLALAAGENLVERGYHAQVKTTPKTSALFQLDGTRKPIRLASDGFVVGTATLPDDELLSRAHTRPETFSPNVLLRPIVQDMLFPTAAYVAGPHELAYFGQLRKIYESFGVPMPLIYPRASVTLVDHATIKFLKRYELDFETLQAQDDAALNQLLVAQLPESVERAVGEAEVAIAERLATIGTTVPAIDTTLEGAVKTTRGRMERDLRNLRGKIIQAAKRRDKILQRQFKRTRALTFPQGEPQERIVGAVYFLNRYGPSLIDRLLADMPVTLGQHWLLTV